MADQPAGANEGRERKRRKLICTNCRRRKAKCDSLQPECTTCKAYKDVCIYEKPPSIAYVRSLEDRIDELSRQLESRGGSRDDHHIETLRGSFSSPSTAPPENMEPQISSVTETSNQPLDSDHGAYTESPVWISEISTDGHGGVAYHNPTSAIHESPLNGHTNPRRESFPASGAFGHEGRPSLTGPSESDHQVKQTLVSNAARQKQIEHVALQNMAHHTQIPEPLATELLKLHWCWIHPLFMFVYRPAFMRDMALVNSSDFAKPYFSNSLLMVLCAHSARLLHPEQRWYWAQKYSPASTSHDLIGTMTTQAQHSLGMETINPSSIPTIQALLQQSAREIAFGRSSQAWLYSGMAFRIATDLGIHLPASRLQDYVSSLSAEDIEIRKRLFWSCYTWDKAISLYLGRMPHFTPPVSDDMLTFMDDFTENDLWEPYYGSSNDASETTPPYPPTTGHLISCFTNLCKLCVILSKVMLEIYGSSSDSGRQEQPGNPYFIEICSDLQKWWTHLPDNIRLVPKSLPQLGPPPHIISLNLLYHTTIILVHRPFILGAKDLSSNAVQRSYNICLDATAAIHNLLRLMVTTFGFGHVTYLNSYSAYIAATIAIFRFQLEETQNRGGRFSLPGEQDDLKFFLEVLQKTAKAMPALTRSVEIIKGHLGSLLERRTKLHLASLFPETESVTPRAQSANAQVRASNDLGLEITDPHLVGGATAATEWDEQLNPPDLFSDSWLFNDEGLPAFPGQQFPIGTDNPFGHGLPDAEARAAFLSFNLDPHLRLNHTDIDWDFSTFTTE